MTRLCYAGLDLDRAGYRRDDPAWLAGAVADPAAVARPLWQDRCLLDQAGVPVVLPLSGQPELRRRVTDPDDPASGTIALLGLDAGTPVFAADLSDLAEHQALALAGAAGLADVRALVTALPAREAGLLAYARGLLHWNRNQRYCGTCGARAASRDGGHLRVCTGPACGRLLFPRIEPAVITLVQSPGPPARCLLARHRGSPAGGYSMLAGFVEIGESLEDAVRREVAEEVGVTVTDARYVGSQAWPFPAGIMLGFRAVAGGHEEVSPDGREVLAARWFTRDQLREHAAETGRLGRPDSIDHVMLTSWLSEQDDTA